MKISRAKWMEWDDAFWAFHDANPWVYDFLVERCREAQQRGKQRIGMSLLISVLRWEAAMQTNPTDQFKSNENHCSRYARLIMYREPGLEDFFETRRSDADNFDPSRGHH